MLGSLRRAFSSDSAAVVDVEGAKSSLKDEGSAPIHAFEEGNFTIDEHRPMKIIVVGAGFSGILAGIRLRQYIPNVEFTIYEKEDGLGGTWYVNRYPGVACDVPAHCYQYTFENKSDWSSLYSPGAEILASINEIASKYKIEPYIKFRHELVHAEYIEESGRWHVKIKRPTASDTKQYEVFDEEGDFLFLNAGLLHRWNWPDIDGLRDFKGSLVHSANWDLGGASWQADVKNWGDKNVAVVGLGCSALQIVSALQDKVAKLSQYARGKAWVGTLFAQEKMSDLLSRDLSQADNMILTEEDKRVIAANPDKAWEFRIQLENALFGLHTYTLRDSDLQKACLSGYKAYMEESLAQKPEVAAKLIPDYPVGVRRISPAPGYLKALTRDNVDLVSTPIKRFTADGIETTDGATTKQDIIILATGFDMSFQYPFPVIGRNGANLRDKWEDNPANYLSICTDGFPNFFFTAGPNSAIGAGSFLVMIEHQVEYIVKTIEKLQRERIKSIEVKPKAVHDFNEVIEHYFPKTVFTEPVRSWYKRGQEEGRVTGLWPGSGLHQLRALKHPRWEDYDYEYLDKSGNCLHWFGNGMTVGELTPDGFRAWYLDKDYVDVPPVPA